MYLAFGKNFLQLANSVMVEIILQQTYLQLSKLKQN